MKSKHQIFFSYAWENENESPGEGREKLVNELYESLLHENYHVIRDKYNLKYKDFISDFINKLGKGKCIVVAISQKYLESPYCMFELYEIARNSNFDKNLFREKILPIMVEFVDLDNPAVIDRYLSFWENEYNTWSDLVKKRPGQLAIEQLQRYDKIKMIYQNFGKLTEWLADINTLNAQLISKDNFAEIKSAIIETVGPEPDVVLSDPILRSRFVKMLGSWQAITLLIATLLIVSVLLFGHVATAEIELDLSISEVKFRLPKPQVLTNAMLLSSLGVSGLQEVQLPASENFKAWIPREPDGSAVLLSVDTSSEPSGTITLDALALPGGTQIGMRLTDVPGQHRLSLKGKELNLPVNVNGLVEIRLPPVAPVHHRFVSPKSIHLQSGPDKVDVDFMLLSGSESVFSRPILADSLSLLRIDEHVENNYSLVRRVSTILSGTLYLKSSGRQERLLPTQQIRFEWSQGEIRTLQVQGDHIDFAFHGRVKGMTAGEEDNRINLMPTYLEWLKKSHGLSLIGGTTLYLFGLIFGAWRWWRAST
ncbi:MAG: toll/interleukin-1 receptor domain-containing protein [Chitinophagaceae bacterium]